VVLPKAIFAPQATFFALPRDHDINLMRCRLQKSLRRKTEAPYKLPYRGHKLSPAAKRQKQISIGHPTSIC
jgi:hypothetical protein